MASTLLPPGTAPIKPEFLVSSSATLPAPDDDIAEDSTSHYHGHTHPENGDGRTEPRSRKRLTKDERKSQRGANKGRKFGKVRDELDLCWKIANGTVCEFGSGCRFTHDIPQYLAAKLADIHIRDPREIMDTAPFIMDVSSVATEELKGHSDVKCPIYEETGECRFGFKCRFLSGHASTDESRNLCLRVDEEKKARSAVSSHEVNFIDNDVLKLLRTKKYPTPIADAYLHAVQADPDSKSEHRVKESTVVVAEPEQDEIVAEGTALTAEELIQARTGESLIEGQTDGPDVPMYFSEKKRLHWAGKTYLAPLTTVGNLPFRRLCVDFGADITCGEMGLANSFLSGSKEEWSLVRRHPSERIFGVQVAGNKPGNLVPMAEVLSKEIGSDIDFVDVNCGCPIDLVFKTGSGSALLDAPGKLGKILAGMNKALGEIPVTVKLRTGVKDGRNTAHKLMPRLSTDFGAGCITLHGRTRQQRYTRLADWDYIKECVEAVKAAEKDQDLPPVPIFGGGDCFSSEDYWTRVESTGVDGIMVGRGALIKPWLFTEIKEHREWDISARERLDIIRKVCHEFTNLWWFD
ncbi:zinc finger dihydrouridine synthase [Amanita muscaria]